MNGLVFTLYATKLAMRRLFRRRGLESASHGPVFLSIRSTSLALRNGET